MVRRKRHKKTNSKQTKLEPKVNDVTSKEAINTNTQENNLTNNTNSKVSNDISELRYDLLNNKDTKSEKETIYSTEITSESENIPDVSDVSTVSENVSDVSTVSENVSDVSTVSENVSDVSTVSENISDVTATSENISDVSTVSENISDVSTVSENISDVTATSENISNVSTEIPNKISMNFFSKPTTNTVNSTNANKLANLKHQVANKNAVVDKILNNSTSKKQDKKNKKKKDIPANITKEQTVETNETRGDITNSTQNIVKKLISLMSNKIIKFSAILFILLIFLYSTYTVLDSFSYKKYGVPILKTDFIKEIKDKFLRNSEEVKSYKHNDNSPIEPDSNKDIITEVTEGDTINIPENSNNEVIQDDDSINTIEDSTDGILEEDDIITDVNTPIKTDNSEILVSKNAELAQELKNIQIQLTTYKFIIESIDSGYKRDEIKKTLLSQRVDLDNYTLSLLNKYALPIPVNDNVLMEKSEINNKINQEEVKKLLGTTALRSSIAHSRMLLSVLVYSIRQKVVENKSFSHDSYLMSEIATTIADPKITSLVNRIAHHSDITYHSGNIFSTKSLLILFDKAKKKTIANFNLLKYGTFLGKIKSFISTNFYIVKTDYNNLNDSDFKHYDIYLYKIRKAIKTNQFIEAYSYFKYLDSDMFFPFKKLEVKLEMYQSLTSNMDDLIKILSTNNNSK